MGRVAAVIGNTHVRAIAFRMVTVVFSSPDLSYTLSGLKLLQTRLCRVHVHICGSSVPGPTSLVTAQLAAPADKKGDV